MIPGSASPLLLTGAAGAAGYQIDRSLRFNSSDSAYLSRTPSSAGNRKTWTWSGWVKQSVPEDLFGKNLFSTGASTSAMARVMLYYNTLYFDDTSLSCTLQTASVYRDFSAWMHLVVAFDTTQPTASNRVKLYVNGSQVTAFSTATHPTQNTDGLFNLAAAHSIGREQARSYAYFDGYLADVHFIDGQALDPTDFGEYDNNNVWQPKAYAGTYGTNGFHLNFSDNSTAAALGTDTSGNSNTWTVNNLSVASGAGNDSFVDSPTNGTQTDTGVGGEVVGNYCTWNPLKLGASYTLSNGNLDIAGSGANLGVVSTIGFSTGKWYWEITTTSSVNGDCVSLGVVRERSKVTDAYPGDTGGFGWRSIGSILEASSNVTVNKSVSSYTNGDILQIAFDANAGKVWLGKNGTWIGSGNPSAGSEQTITYTASEAPYFPASRPYLSSATANFGQRPFAYTAPSGYKALCTTNLPSTTITTSGSYTGNSSTEGPFVYLNGVPTAMTVNSNAVTFGTHADKLSSGFKIRTSSLTYNQSGSTYNYSITSTGDPFKRARAQANP